MSRINRVFTIILCLVPLSAPFMAFEALGQKGPTPLEFLKEQEMKHRDKAGEIYLGKVMTIIYPAYAYALVEVDEAYHPFLLELTDVLKSPLRKNYRLVLKGYTDSRGSPEANMILSKKRAENLKDLLIEKYYMEGERISAEGHGEATPVASNETVEGRRLNRRVEINVYGDVSEAVRFLEKEEDVR